MNNTTKLNNIINILNEYDSKGAALYVIVVITWYFLFVSLFVVWQIKRKRDKQKDVKHELLLQAVESQVKSKQILEELCNPEMRKWAWSIYRKESNEIDYEYEMKTLENLNKQIDKIERKKMCFNDKYCFNLNSKRSTSFNYSRLNARHSRIYGKTKKYQQQDLPSLSKKRVRICDIKLEKDEKLIDIENMKMFSESLNKKFKKLQQKQQQRKLITRNNSFENNQKFLVPLKKSNSLIELNLK